MVRQVLRRVLAGRSARPSPAARGLPNNGAARGEPPGSHRDIEWFHSIELGNGQVSRGVKSPEVLEAEFGNLGLTRAMLAGKTVLDIGCADGFMCLRCEALGAQVTGIDGVFRDGMKYVRRHLKPSFKFYTIDVLSPSFAELGRFDVVLSLGVLYHTIHPYEHLTRLAHACGENGLLFLESSYYNLAGFEDAPTIFFNYDGKLWPDLSSPTWPSIPWITQTLLRVGFANPLILHSSGGNGPGRVTVRAERRHGPLTPFLYAAEQTQQAPRSGH
jgi:tRNA (mo5U34)-methyltransferase